MDINASIIDQRVRNQAEAHADSLTGDQDKQRSAAFVLLCLQTILDLDADEALDCLVDGGHDAGVDGIHTSGDLGDGELIVTLVQAKYKTKLDGRSAFPAGEIQKLIHTVGALFDPGHPLTMHAKLEARVEEIRSRVRDGDIPRVRVMLCNNGKEWQEDGQTLIDHSGLGKQVTWEHVNHELLVELLQKQKSVDDQLQLRGKMIVEEFNFRRVLIGKIAVEEIAALFERYGDRLLDRNIRRYLGMKNNRVNQAIRSSLIDSDQQQNFYFYNNGITMICSKFNHNALQAENYQVRVKDLHIINGGQTCKTIQETVAEESGRDFGQASVLLRLYEIDNDDDLVNAITYATNSQNPVDLRDLRANDQMQRKLEIGLHDLGWTYKRKRDGATSDTQTITTAVAAEAVMAVWRRKPHIAKFRRTERFGHHYEHIFDSTLDAAQIVIAVALFRQAENERKRPSIPEPPRFLPYASHVLAMIMGQQLLQEANIELAALDHRNFEHVLKLVEDRRSERYLAAIETLRGALQRIGLDVERASLQRLSAAFRRGDLLTELA